MGHQMTQEQKAESNKDFNKIIGGGVINKPHPKAEFIIAWAEGRHVEVKRPHSWARVPTTHRWSVTNEYRILNNEKA